MGSRNFRTGVLVVVLAATVALSGCAGTDTGTNGTTATESPAEQMSPDEGMSPGASTSTDGSAEGNVSALFSQRMSNLENYHANVTVTTTVGERTTNVTSEVWARTETGEVRQEVIDAPRGEGTITIINESAIVNYNPRSGSVTRLNRSTAPTGNGAMSITSLLSNTTVERLGTTELDGEQTYRVRYMQTNTTMREDTTVTAWLDAETYFPKRIETTASTRQGNVTSITTFEDVELDTEIPDSRFTLDVPANATSAGT